MMVSWIGYPTPLLSYNSVPPPVRVMSTLKAEIEVVDDSLDEKLKNWQGYQYTIRKDGNLPVKPSNHSL